MTTYLDRNVIVSIIWRIIVLLRIIDCIRITENGLEHLVWTVEGCVEREVIQLLRSVSVSKFKHR